MKRPLLLLALVAFAAPRLSAQDIPSVPDAPDAGSTGSTGGSGSASASGAAAAIQQAVTSTGCQPWQLGVIQRAAAAATVRAQIASSASAGIGPTREGASESSADSQARRQMRNTFERALDGRQVSDLVAQIRRGLDIVSAGIRGVIRGQVPLPTLNVSCAPSTDTDCRANGGNPRYAYVRGTGPLIHICPEFFQGTVQTGEDDRVAAISQGLTDPGRPSGTDSHMEEERVRQITHESAHVAGIGTMDGECYDGPPFSCGPPTERMLSCESANGLPTDPNRAHWADSWALYITCMAGRGDPAH
jgi:hypothetical protein